MKQILVPIDFSPTSKKAFRYAVDLAFKSSGSVVLYHLYTPGKTRTKGVFETLEGYDKQTESNYLKRLQRLKKKVLSESGEVPVSTVVGRSPVVNNILKFAESNHIDLIVMGTQGADGLKKVTVGSVAARVMKESQIPVLLVPEKFEWKLPETIVFTTGFHDADREALFPLFQMAELYNAGIIFVNLYDPQNPMAETNKNKFETFAYGLKREFSDLRIQFNQVQTSSVEKAMETLHEEVPYDLLVMARRKLGFMGRFFQKSFTKKMAYITALPLLIIPEK